MIRPIFSTGIAMYDLQDVNNSEIVEYVKTNNNFNKAKDIVKILNEPIFLRTRLPDFILLIITSIKSSINFLDRLTEKPFFLCRSLAMSSFLKFLLTTF